MRVDYSDVTTLSDAQIAAALAKLEPYRAGVKDLVERQDFSRPESALATTHDPLMRQVLGEALADFTTPVRHVILVGIGGSSLGVEAVHHALGGAAVLHVLDAASPARLTATLQALAAVPLEDLAVCVVSKSGQTTETLANASALLGVLVERYGDALYRRTICVGDPENALLLAGRAHKAATAAMQPSIGGRYSAFTVAGLIPLSLLGHDIEELLSGLASATAAKHERLAAEGAARLFGYLERGYRSLNCFVLDPSLESLARWYRQLAAESLGKETTRAGGVLTACFLPTVSTPVDLHSIGQLYFSGFPGVYTDFLVLAGASVGAQIPAASFAPEPLSGREVGEVADAIATAVVAAYRERSLPHRATTLEVPTLAYELGLHMGSRMLEVMYLAELMDVDAFTQPNVELYKAKTRDLLGL